MSHPIYPSIWTDGQGAEAALLYTSLFPNSRIVHDSPMVVAAEIDGQALNFLNGGPRFSPNPSISLFAAMDTEADLERAWAALSEGGKVLMPLQAYPWSNRYGWLQDRFGLSWQLSLGPTSDTGGQRLTPALLFTGNRFGQAEAALQFYTGLFPNSTIEGVMRNEGDRSVQHAQCYLDGYTVMLMDSNEAHGFDFSEGVSLVITCDTQEEIDRYWTALASGGQESMCGWVRDRFGVWWQVVPSVLGRLMSDPEKGGRVVQRFMKMKKFEIAPLLEA